MASRVMHDTPGPRLAPRAGAGWDHPLINGVWALVSASGTLVLAAGSPPGVLSPASSGEKRRKDGIIQG